MFFRCVFYIGAFFNQNPTEEKEKTNNLNHVYPGGHVFWCGGSANKTFQTETDNLASIFNQEFR